MQTSCRLEAKLHRSVVLRLCNVPSLQTILALTPHYPSMCLQLPWVCFVKQGDWNSLKPQPQILQRVWMLSLIQLAEITEMDFRRYLSPFNYKQLCRNCKNNTALSLTNPPSKVLHLPHLSLPKMLLVNATTHIWILPLNFYRDFDHCFF